MDPGVQIIKGTQSKLNVVIIMMKMFTDPHYIVPLR